MIIREENTSTEYSKIPRVRQSTPKTPKRASRNYIRTIGKKKLIWACRAARCQRNGKLEKFRPYKKGNRRSPMDYIPVSLTSIVCKLLESLVREEIISHMRSNKRFSPYQYSFIDKRIYHTPATLCFRQMDQNHWWWRDNRCHIHGLHEGLWQGGTWTSPQKGRSLWHRRATAGMDKKFPYRKKTNSKSGRRFI